jgi:hypothetical protein
VQHVECEPHTSFLRLIIETGFKQQCFRAPCLGPLPLLGCGAPGFDRSDYRIPLMQERRVRVSVIARNGVHFGRQAMEDVAERMQFAIRL